MMDKDTRLKGWMYEAYRRHMVRKLDPGAPVDLEYFLGFATELRSEVEALARLEARGDKLKIVDFEITIEPETPNLVIRAMRAGEDEWVEVAVKFSEVFQPASNWG